MSYIDDGIKDIYNVFFNFMYPNFKCLNLQCLMNIDSFKIGIFQIVVLFFCYQENFQQSKKLPSVLGG